MITVDPHTTNMLRSVFPSVNNEYSLEVKNYLEILAERDFSKVKELNLNLVIHDSCIYARHEGITKEPRQAECCAWGNPPLSIYNLVYPLVGNADSLRKLPLGQFHWLEEFLQEHLSWVSRQPVSWNSNHFSLHQFLIGDNLRFRPLLDPRPST